MGDYKVDFVKHGVRLTAANAELTRIVYGRKLDDISEASVEMVVSKDCCGQLGAVDHWNTDMVISATNDAGAEEILWRGPVDEPKFVKGKFTCTAKDVLAYLDARIIEQDFNFASQDVSDIAIALMQYALTKDPRYTPVYEIKRYTSGTDEARVVDASALRMTWAVIQEMLDTGLDVTTFGKYIVVGLPNFATFDLDDTQVLGDTGVSKPGSEYAGRIIANASRDIVGIWPPGPAQGTDDYPLVEQTVTDGQIQDTESATNAAKARWDYGKNGVRRVRAEGGLQLLPESQIDPRTLLAGQLIRFTATETCYTATETLRVGSMTVTVEKGTEKAVIELQPIGGTAADAA